MRQLSKDDMKAIQGGAPGPSSLWACYDHDGSGPYYDCGPTNPATRCGEASCSVVGTCTGTSPCA